MSSKLILDDGSEFIGKPFGASATAKGEVVFNTGMMGYPETFTDPSYEGQILVLTFPLIGNYGVQKDTIVNGISENFESEKIHIRGLIISDYCENPSHHAMVKNLGEWLKENNIPGIYDIDTRALTKKIRSFGVMKGIMNPKDRKFEDYEKRNFVSEVSIKKVITYKNNGPKIIAVDCGMKHSIIKNLLLRGFEVIRVPWDYDFQNSRIEYNGVFISNGPGDPKLCSETIKNLKWLMSKKIPIFGICLGNQLLGLASGCDTYKLKFGHRSQNQPCIDVRTERCYITSQNHGYAINEKTLKKDWEVWFRNANDNTVEGIRHKKLPFMSVQFHPESMPGPFDTNYLFDEFRKMVEKP